MTAVRRGVGFTLVELLVVIVVIALIVSVTVASFGDRGGTADLAREADRMAALIELARERAEFSAEEWGVDVAADRYAFVVYDPRERRWAPAPDTRFRARELPARMRLGVKVDDLELAHGADQADGMAADGNSDGNGEQTREGADALRPEILLLSSGEVSQFELRIGRDDATGEAWLLRSDGVSPVRAEPAGPRT